MATALAPTVSLAPSRPGRVRIALASVAVLACLPYLALKVHWLLGGSIGLNDAAVASSATMEVANLLTAGMEAVGAALAVLLILPIGRRLPARVLHVPMFVGTGLLGGILLLVPTAIVLSGFDSGPSPDASSDPIQSWVYATVYGGFLVLGLCLLTIFAGYAWQRWVVPGSWTTRLAALRPVPERARTIAVAHGIFMVAVCAVGALVPASHGLLGGHDVVAVLMAVMCLGGLATLAHGRPGRLHAYVPLLMVYVGAAAVTAWGAFFLVLMAVPNPLVGDTHVSGWMLLVLAVRVVNGALTLVCLQRLAPLTRRAG